MLFQSETIKTLTNDTNGTISEVHFYNTSISCKSLSGRRVGSFIHYNCINIVSLLTLTKIHVSAYASLANRFRNIYASKFPGSFDSLTTLHSWRKRKRSLYSEADLGERRVPEAPFLGKKCSLYRESLKRDWSVPPLR